MASQILRQSRKIYVGNVPWCVGRVQLEDFFKQFGPVRSVDIAYDKSTGCSKGYAFVEFDKQAGDQPLKALESRNVLQLEGNTLNIQLGARSNNRKQS